MTQGGVGTARERAPAAARRVRSFAQIGYGPALAAGGLSLALLLTAANAASPSGQFAPIPQGSVYVAMGSSYAAGPGITRPADTPPGRCRRSTDNYAHQLARKRGLHLVDVSCSGATTANILGPWNELPAQLDAVTPDTKLVTVTIGGNDVGYIGGLFAASCAGADRIEASPMCRYFQGLAHQTGAKAPSVPTDKTWAKLESALEQLVRAVRQRAPAARFVFVDYFTILPAHGLCAHTPLSVDAAVVARETAARLAQLTAAVAERTGVEDIRVSELSGDHDACSKTPWVTGFIPPTWKTQFAPYHPNIAGMTVVAGALDAMLGG